MANNATNALEEKILNSIINGASVSLAVHTATLKLQLYSTIPTAANIEDGTAGTLITGGGYADIGLTTTNMEVATDGSGVTVLQNKIEIAFVEATADYSAQVKAVGIIGSLDGGTTTDTLLFAGELSDYKTVTTGDTFKFAEDALKITLA